jgi:hypothetical protein
VQFAWQAEARGRHDEQIFSIVLGTVGCTALLAREVTLGIASQLRVAHLRICNLLIETASFAAGRAGAI